MYIFFFQAEDGIRDLVRSRGLGDVYKRQVEELRRIEGVGRVQLFGAEQAMRIWVDPAKLISLSLIHI